MIRILTLFDYPAESWHCQRHTSFIFLGILLHQSINQTGSCSNNTHMLIIQKMDNTRCPFSSWYNFLDVLNNLNRHRAALCLTTSIVSLIKILKWKTVVQELERLITLKPITLEYHFQTLLPFHDCQYSLYIEAPN